MGAMFLFGLLTYYRIRLWRKKLEDGILSKFLCKFYIMLGCSAILIDLFDVMEPITDSSYISTLYLLCCIIIGIDGFINFSNKNLQHLITQRRGIYLIEIFLIVSQLLAIIFFLPFVISALTGDLGENRLMLESRMAELGSHGFINTFAGIVSQLFPFTLVFSAVRLAQGHSRVWDELFAYLLIFASFSYIFYILAYVGRDGVVFWILTFVLVYVIFFPYIPKVRRHRIYSIGLTTGGLMVIPFMMITISRFENWNHGIAWSITEYFGLQINTFSDYFNIDRPLTLGAANFSLFLKMLCEVTSSLCFKWEDIRPGVLEIYLNQGVQPWLFGTYISDFSGDFGYFGAFFLFVFFFCLCRKIAYRPRSDKQMTMSRLLLIIFLFLIPYWGVFYFRYSIANSAILTNLAFIFITYLINRKAISKLGHRKLYQELVR